MQLITPLLVQVILIFFVMFYLVRYRVSELSAKQANPDDVPLRQAKWTDHTARIGNNFLSQFELPVLFIALVILQVVTKTDDTVQLYLAWAFVAMRVLHMLFHTMFRHNQARVMTFAIAAFILLVMWVRFAIAFYS